MIVKSIKSPTSMYGKYFLANEAPEEVQPGAKVKVITVKPDNRKRKDFSDIPDEEETTEPSTGNTEEPNDTTPDEGQSEENLDPQMTGQQIDSDEANDDTDFASDSEDTPPEDNADDNTGTDPTVSVDGEEVQDDTADDTDFSATDDADTTTDTEDNSEDMDFSAGGEEDTDSGAEDTPEETTSEEPTEGEESKGPGIDYGATRKFNLYKEFMSLHNSVENFVNKLESKIKDDVKENQIIKISTDTLREVEDLLYDYMILKYESCTYDQNLIFFQKMVVTVQLVFNLLSNLQKKLTK